MCTYAAHGVRININFSSPGLCLQINYCFVQELEENFIELYNGKAGTMSSNTLERMANYTETNKAIFANDAMVMMITG